MSYSIYANHEILEKLEVENLEVNYLEKKDELMLELDEFKEYIENKYNKDSDKLSSSEIESEINEFKCSEEWYEIRENLQYPMYNMHHVLQNTNCEYEMDLFMELQIPAVTVNRLTLLDVNVLSLTGCGMDFSESLELAYYVFDGVSPIKANDIFYLNDKLKGLLLFCRETVKTKGNVAPNEIRRKWEEINA